MLEFFDLFMNDAQTFVITSIVLTIIFILIIVIFSLAESRTQGKEDIY